MEKDRSTKTTFRWIPKEKWRRGQPRTPPKDTVMRDVQHKDTKWEDMLEKAIDRDEWRSRTALYVLRMGRTKV